MNSSKRATIYAGLSIPAALAQTPFMSGAVDLHPLVLGIISGLIFGFSLFMAELLLQTNARDAHRNRMREGVLVISIVGVGMPLSITAGAATTGFMARGLVEGAIRGILDAFVAVVVASVIWSAVLSGTRKILGRAAKASHLVSYSVLFVGLTCVLLAVDQALTRRTGSSLPLWSFIAIEECASAIIVTLGSKQSFAREERAVLHDNVSRS